MKKISLKASATNLLAKLKISKPEGSAESFEAEISSEQIEDVFADYETTSVSLKKANDDLSDANNKVTNLETQVKDLEEKLAKAPAAAPNAQQEDVDQNGKSSKTSFSIVPAHAVQDKVNNDY